MAIATASDILNGKTGYTAPDGTKITGSISATKGAQTYRRYYNQTQTISGGVYLTGNQTIYGIYTSGTNTDNYQYGKSMTISPDYMSTTGSYTGSGTATSSAIMSGYAGFVKGSQVNGTMTSSDLNPYPVCNGYTKYSSGTESGYTVSASPSSGNGSSASYTVGLRWNGTTLEYTGAASGRTYDTFVLSCPDTSFIDGDITCTFIGSRGYGPTFNIPIVDEQEASFPV